MERESKGAAGAARPETGARWRAWCVGRAHSLGRIVLALDLAPPSSGCDLYHEPNNIPLPSDLPTVVTVHDLSALLHPEWHPAHRAAEYQARFHKGIRKRVASSRFPSLLVRNSFTRSACVPIGSRTASGVRPGLGPMPAAEVRATLRRLGLPPRYLLYLGTISARM